MSLVFDAITGGQSGFLKAANLDDEVVENFPFVSRGEILFGRFVSSVEANPKIYLCHKSSVLTCYDLSKETVTASSDPTELSAKELVKGFDLYQDGRSVLGLSSGRISITDLDDFSVSTNFTTAKQLDCLAVAGAVLATGGREHDLSLWDLQEPHSAPVFCAKNVRHNHLELRVPVWIRAITFWDRLPITGTAYQQIRVYDPRAQRRPVREFTFGSGPISALTHLGANSLAAASSQGDIGIIDMRKAAGTTVRRLRGAAGGVRALCAHPDRLPFLASVGADRRLRVHRTDPSGQLIANVYCSTALNFVQIWPSWKPGSRLEHVKDEPTEEIADVSDSDSADELWDRLPSVSSRKSKKSSELSDVDVKRQKIS